MKEKVFYVINETETERQGGREETRRETVLEFMNLDITKTNIKYIRDSVPERYQGRPPLLETFKPSYALSKVKNENDAIRNRITEI